MIGFLTFILFVVGVLLIVIIIIQPDRSHGLASSFGQGAASTLFGVSDDGGPLLKITIALGSIFIILSLILYVLSSKG